MKEKATDARFIGATVKIEVCMKVEKKFRHSAKDSNSTIYARALAESVEGVELTAQDYLEIAKETQENEEARRREREARALKRAGSSRNKKH